MKKFGLKIVSLGKKKVVLSLIFGFLLSIFMQIYCGTPDYGSMLSSSAYMVGEVQETAFAEVVEGNYLLEHGTGNLVITPPEGEISGVLVALAEPVALRSRVQIYYYHQEDGVEKKDVIIDYIEALDEFYYLPLPEKTYSYLEVQFIYVDTYLFLSNRASRDPRMEVGAEEFHKLILEDIFLVEDEWTEGTIQQSKLSFGWTVFLGVIGFLFACFFFLYPEKGKKIAPYAFLFLVFYALFTQGIRGGDDSTMFLHMKDQYTLLEYTKLRYEVWSSRNVIEVPLYYLVHNMELWTLLTAGIVVLLAYAVGQLFPRRENYWFMVMLLLFFPLNVIYEVGWVATTLNYLWVVAFILYSFVPFAKEIRGEKVGKFLYLTSLLACFYGGNQEQGAALLLGFYLLFCFYLIYLKKGMKKFLPHLFVVLGSLVHHLTCGGNYIRKEADIPAFFPDFEEKSLLEKFEMGYSSTVFDIFFTNVFYLVVVCVFVILYAWVKLSQKEILEKVDKRRHMFAFLLGACPLTLMLTSYFQEVLLLEPISFLTYLEENVTVLGTEMGTNGSLLAVAFLSLMFFSLLGAVYLVMEKKEMAFLAVIILLAGLASRVILGFSPTISSIRPYRTYTFIYISFFIVALILYENLRKVAGKKMVSFLRYGTGIACCWRGIDMLFFEVLP